ncbi:MAG TPA: lipoprotein insertase outer membrane protein LolB [Noviherbaspirillum sp.]
MNVRVVRRYASAALLPLLLTACAALPSGTAPGTPTPADVAARSIHESIELSGRLSVRYQSNGRDEALHGSFTWKQTPVLTTVTLLSPLGQTIAVIEVGPHGATLAQAGQAIRTAASVDELTANTLGWPLPVSGLKDWLQGFAATADGVPFRATPENAEVTTQDGWHIRFANWLANDATSGALRPRRIDLTRNTEQAGDVSIRIVIDTWQPL